jgi:hypothetical protein
MREQHENILRLNPLEVNETSRSGQIDLVWRRESMKAEKKKPPRSRGAASSHEYETV